MDELKIILDVMTANRDKSIWAVAQGKTLKIDDSNVPKPISVISNIGVKAVVQMRVKKVLQTI